MLWDFRRLIVGIAFAVLCIASLTYATPVTAAEDAVRTEQVRFPSGSTGTTIRDRIIGRASVSYKLAAEAGQIMTVTLAPSNLATYFNVYEPGRGPGDQALAVSEITGSMVPEINRFRASLPTYGCLHYLRLLGPGRGPAQGAL